VRLTDGSILKGEFSSNTTLRHVYCWIQQQRTDGHASFTMMTSFPRKVFSNDNLDQTLAEAALVPRAVVIIKED